MAELAGIEMLSIKYLSKLEKLDYLEKVYQRLEGSLFACNQKCSGLARLANRILTHHKVVGVGMFMQKPALIIVKLRLILVNIIFLKYQNLYYLMQDFV